MSQKAATVAPPPEEIGIREALWFESKPIPTGSSSTENRINPLALTDRFVAVPSNRNGNGTETPADTDKIIRSGGGYLRIRRSWKNLDTIIFHQGERLYTEDTQHQGICIFMQNRLMSLDVSGTEYRYAVCGKPYVKNGKPFVPVKRITRWPATDGIPSDIPVLPSGKEEAVFAPLNMYPDTAERITVFPREASYE